MPYETRKLKGRNTKTKAKKKTSQEERDRAKMTRNYKRWVSDFGVEPSEMRTKEQLNETMRIEIDSYREEGDNFDQAFARWLAEAEILGLYDDWVPEHQSEQQPRINEDGTMNKSARILYDMAKEAYGK